MLHSCGRPDNFSEMILQKWSAAVSEKDTVIHLGDVAWTTEYLYKLLRLPGKKILIRGNHDDKSNISYMELGFDFSADSLMMNLDGTRVLFSHAPVYWHDADINIHGHFHDLHVEESTRLYLPLSLEQMGYKPLPLHQNLLHSIHSWAARHHQPTVEEMMRLGQSFLRKPRERDLYGRCLSKDGLVERIYRRNTAKSLLETHNLMDLKGNHQCVQFVERFVNKVIDEDTLLLQVQNLRKG